MNALTAFIIAPAIVAALRGKRAGWLALAALFIAVSMFAGELASAVVLWLTCMGFALFKKT